MLAERGLAGGLETACDPVTFTAVVLMPASNRSGWFTTSSTTVLVILPRPEVGLCRENLILE